MSRLITIGYESGAIAGEDAGYVLSGSDGTGSSATIVTSGVLSGKCSLQIVTGTTASSGIARQWAFTATLARTYYARGRFNYNAFAPGNSQGLALFELTAFKGVNIRITAGVLKLVSHLAGTVLLTGPTLSTGRTYCLELSYCPSTGACELRLDGVSYGTATAETTTNTNFILWTGSTSDGTSITVTVDDYALNDDQGAAQNSWCGLGQVVMLLPTADISRSGFTNAAAGTTNLWACVDNQPPIGTQVASGTSQITDGTSSTTDNYQATMQTYLAAGVPSSASIVLVQGIANMGNNTTTSRTGGVQVLSNPTIAETTGGTGTTGILNWPTGWSVLKTAVSYAPSVTLGSAPTMEFRKGTASTDFLSCAQMGVLVEYLVTTSSSTVTATYTLASSVAWGMIGVVAAVGGNVAITAAPAFAFSVTAAATVSGDTFRSVGASFPQLSVEVDFTNDPTNPARVWTDVTADVRSIQITRGGRSDELQQTSTGTMSMVLNDRSGAYDPQNASSTHYPNVRSERWVRVRGKWNGVVYNRFMGLIDEWKPGWPSGGKDSVVNVSASDALKVLSLYDLAGNDYPAELSGARVAAICAQAGLPYSVGTGVSMIVDSGVMSAQSYALSHLQAVEGTENGRLFADAGGTIVFQDRHYRAVSSLTAAGTIGDSAGEIRYDDSVAPARNDANLYNEAIVTTSDGVAVTAESAISQDRYFKRTITRSLLTTDQVEALNAATYLTRLYGDPAPKLPALPLEAARDTTTWPTVLAALNSQRFTFHRRPSYGGTLTIDGYVEQVSESIQPGLAWNVSLQLSAAGDQSTWVLGDSTYGLLGGSTYLGY